MTAPNTIDSSCAPETAEQLEVDDVKSFNHRGNDRTAALYEVWFDRLVDDPAGRIALGSKETAGAILGKLRDRLGMLARFWCETAFGDMIHGGSAFSAARVQHRAWKIQWVWKVRHDLLVMMAEVRSSPYDDMRGLEAKVVAMFEAFSGQSIAKSNELGTWDHYRGQPLLYGKSPTRSAYHGGRENVHPAADTPAVYYDVMSSYPKSMLSPAPHPNALDGDLAGPAVRTTEATKATGLFQRMSQTASKSPVYTDTDATDATVDVRIGDYVSFHYAGRSCRGTVRQWHQYGNGQKEFTIEMQNPAGAPIEVRVDAVGVYRAGRPDIQGGTPVRFKLGGQVLHGIVDPHLDGYVFRRVRIFDNPEVMEQSRAVVVDSRDLEPYAYSRTEGVKTRKILDKGGIQTVELIGAPILRKSGDWYRAVRVPSTGFMSFVPEAAFEPAFEPEHA